MKKNVVDKITEAFMATNEGRGVPYVVASVAIEFTLWELQDSGVIGDIEECECGLLRAATDGCPHQGEGNE